VDNFKYVKHHSHLRSEQSCRSVSLIFDTTTSVQEVTCCNMDQCTNIRVKKLSFYLYTIKMRCAFLILEKFCCHSRKKIQAFAEDAPRVVAVCNSHRKSYDRSADLRIYLRWTRKSGTVARQALRRTSLQVLGA